MAVDLLEKYGNNVKELLLIPSDDGVYEVKKNGKLIFSKKDLGRFPELDEIIDIIES